MSWKKKVGAGHGLETIGAADYAFPLCRVIRFTNAREQEEAYILHLECRENNDISGLLPLITFLVTEDHAGSRLAIGSESCFQNS